MNRLLLASLAAAGLLVGSCATSPTGRSQLLAFPESQMATMGASAFAQQKQETPASKDAKKKAYVQCISSGLLKAMGENPAQWEVVLFDSPQVNAFALPGKKIGVYTGLLGVATNQHMVAAVVGHEIGHVIARHSNERMSTQYAAQGGMALAQILSSAAGASSGEQQMLMGALGLGAQYGVILPYGRTQESEADTIGLDLMAKAGFDPREAPKLWVNMAKAGGNQPPQFMSTHPSHETRIRDLEAGLPKALAIQKAALKKQKAPQCQ